MRIYCIYSVFGLASPLFCLRVFTSVTRGRCVGRAEGWFIKPRANVYTFNYVYIYIYNKPFCLRKINYLSIMLTGS